MDSYIFNIVLITLIIVVVLHFVYNKSLHASQNKISENMKNTGALCDNLTYDDKSYTDSDSQSTSHKSVYSKHILNKCKKKIYDDGEYRDPGTYGIDRTSKDKKWYHVVNRLVTNDDAETIIDDSDNEDNKENRKSIRSLKKHIRDNKKRRKKRDDIMRKKCGNIGRLVFDDIYDGNITNNDFDADRHNPPTSKRIMHCMNTDADFIDVYGNKCSTVNDSDEIKKYIREKVLDGREQCGCVVDKSKSNFTRDEVDEYREGHLRFGDKVYGTSAPAIDPVDRTNLITLQGGVRAQGQTIADLYDSLVTIDKPSSTPFAKSPRIGELQNRNTPSSRYPQSFYTDDANNGGRYIKRDAWMYSGEKPTNGGPIFNGIVGNDPMINDDPMMDNFGLI